MGNMLYLTTNLIDGATITVTSEDPLFQKTNLYNEFPSEPFKFNVAAADDTITIDFGSAKQVTFASFHGHNIDSGVTAIQLRYSTDNFAADDNLGATFTKRTPSFYDFVINQTKRYWRIKFVGTNATPIEIGILTLGTYSTPVKNPRHSQEMPSTMPSIRNITRAGLLSVVNLANFPRREIIFAFKGGYTDLEDLQDNLWVGLDYGKNWVVVVPNSNLPNVLHGKFRQDLAITRMWGHPTAVQEIYEYELTLLESAFGITVTT